MIKKRSKKGQASMSGNVGMWVIVILAILLAAWIGWKFLKGASNVQEALPGNLEALSQGCELAASGGLVASYCYETRSLDVRGAKKFGTCDYLVKKYPVDVPSKDLIEQKLKDGKCAFDKQIIAFRQFCQVQPGDKERIFINKVPCKCWISFNESNDPNIEGKDCSDYLIDYTNTMSFVQDNGANFNADALISLFNSTIA